MTGLMQWYQCPPTGDTRLTGGSCVARDAASACKSLHTMTHSPNCIHDTSKAQGMDTSDGW